jgi:hypothetical protein
MLNGIIVASVVFALFPLSIGAVVNHFVQRALRRRDLARAAWNARRRSA